MGIVKRSIALGSLLTGLGLLIPASVMGATATVTGNLTAGSLSLTTSAAPSFSANLAAGDQTPTYSVPATAQDTTGSGSGWDLTITSTQFTTSGPSSHTLAANASTLTAVSDACASGTCTSPSNSISYPLAVPAAPSAPPAVKFFDAAAFTGMGTFTIAPTIAVNVPQNSYAGTYTSTLTLSINSGP